MSNSAMDLLLAQAFPLVAFLLFVVWYFIPAFLLNVFARKPPSIVAIGYSAMTVFALVSGSSTLLHSEFQEHVTGSLVGWRRSVTLSCAITGMTFVVCNLLRSYFNLTALEHPAEKTDWLHQAVITFSGRSRSLELLLRALMFTCLVFMIHQLSLLSSSSLVAHWSVREQLFQDHFPKLWVGAFVFYSVLLIWDFVVWRYAPSASRAKVHKKLRPTLYTHGVGLGISLCLVFSAWTANWDFVALLLLALAAAGLGFMGHAIVKDKSRMLETYRIGWKGLKEWDTGLGGPIQKAARILGFTA